MNRHVSRWPVARLLVTTHLPFLAFIWLIAMALIVLVIVIVAVGSTPTRSIIDIGGPILRFFALGYGIHLTYDLLPTHIAHGRTRREFLAQLPLFLVAASTLGSILMTVAYWAETLLYRAADWPQKISDERLYTTVTQYPRVVLSYWAMLLVWLVVGALLGGAFHRFEAGGILFIPVGVVLIAVTGFGIGFNALPFVDLTFGVDTSVLATLALSVGCAGVGLVLTWAIGRDLPLRNNLG